MKKQVLPPAMEYGKEPISAPRCLGSAAMVDKVSNVADLLVLVSDGSDLFGDSENDMKIVCLENFGCSFFNQAARASDWHLDNGGRRSCLAGPLVITAVTALEMTAEAAVRHTSIAVMTRRWAVESDPSCC